MHVQVLLGIYMTVTFLAAMMNQMPDDNDGRINSDGGARSLGPIHPQRKAGQVKIC